MINAKQKRFCNEYLIDLNATQAAIRAGYSKKTANEQGARMLAKVSIQEFIQSKRKLIESKLEITREMVIEGYRKLSFYDSRKYYDEDGNIKKVTDFPDDEAFALSAFEVMEEKGGNGNGEQVLLGYTKKIKTSDRRAALDSLCKVMGYNAPTKIAQTDKDGDDVQIIQIIQLPDNNRNKIDREKQNQVADGKDVSPVQIIQLPDNDRNKGSQ